MQRILKYFFRGLLVLLPVAATVYVVHWVFTLLNDALFARLGTALGAGGEALRTVLGIAATVVLIMLVGTLTSNFVGRWAVGLLESLFHRLPLVKLLYGSVKDLLGAFVGDKKSFDRPVLVSLTDGGAAKVVGFVTRDSLEFLGIDGHVAVYLPQSYNFAGNLMVFPRDRVQPLSADSSDVMAFLVSGGVSGEAAETAVQTE